MLRSRCTGTGFKNRRKKILQGFLNLLSEKKYRKKEFNLPAFPTTTIGSFPQTADVKANRASLRKGEISEEEYIEFNRNKIAECVKEQEETGLDVLVHGEFERNDMVEYFGEQLKGYLFTEKAWVQSYGTRCVKPPIIWGDVSRSKPMTVDWSVYAQSLTEKADEGNADRSCNNTELVFPS